MKKNKFLSILVFVLAIASFFNITYASEEMLDVYGSSSTSYSISQDENDIYLPFMRFSNGNMIIDKQVENMGAYFSSKTIDINSDVKSMSAMFATDSIRVNADVKNSVMFSTAAIVIDSHITSDLILFSTSEITITKKAIIDGDIICYTSNLNVLGNVNGSVIATCSNAKISGTIQKDLRVQTDNIQIESEDLVKGKLYIQSYEIIEGIKEKYPEVINKIISKAEVNSKDEIKNIVFVGIVYALLYFILLRVKKGEILSKSFEKVKKYKTNVVMFGTVGILIAPIITMLCLLLLIGGLYMIALPILIIYFGIIIISTILTIFIVGATIMTYIYNKYLIKKTAWYTVLTSFMVFVVLQVLTKIPYVSAFISIIYLMASFGILAVCIVKKLKSNDETTQK